MNNTVTILNISDIHFDQNEPEDQGLVLNAFLADINRTLADTNKDYTFCIIAGDIVNDGSRACYMSFYEMIITKLNEYIPLSHIFITPGNHDFDRSILETQFDDHQSAIDAYSDEVKFNKSLEEDGNILIDKFNNFKEFCTEYVCVENFNLTGYVNNITPEISVFCLNSALCSCGGFDEIKDTQRLKIDTSKLNQWVSSNIGRTKILVMHNPIRDLTEYAQDEINSMRKSGIDILISGHYHSSDMSSTGLSSLGGCKMVSLPQLYSNKGDLNGYSVMQFTDNNLSRIIFRQWSKTRRKFTAGDEFSDTDDGVINIPQPIKQTEDHLARTLSASFYKSMRSYSRKPSWEQRYLCDESPKSKKEERSEVRDYLSIINDLQNYHIVAAKQFGLTCFAKYLALKAYEVKSEYWMYVDCFSLRLSKVESTVDDILYALCLNDSSVKCLLLDHWDSKAKEAAKILSKLRTRFSSIPIIIFSNYQDQIVFEDLDSVESHEGFHVLHLKELDMKGLRGFVHEFNKEVKIAEDNTVLERLVRDIKDLNVHRTPINCLQLLLAFESNFENRPVNRTRVLDYILKLIFDNPGNLVHGNTIDERNCSFIMGYFCEYLLRDKVEYFTENQFFKVLTQFCAENYNTTNIYDLLSVLKYNQIIIIDGDFLKFRFSYWIYYFAAKRMNVNEDFLRFMQDENHYIFTPEIVEFYTGLDGFQKSAVELITNELNALSDKVKSNIGIEANLDLFSNIKWALNETESGLTMEQLSKNIQESNMPDAMKDVIADKDYNSVQPYNQAIDTFLEEYYVRNLMDLTTSAARTLRNSEFVSAEAKESLAMAIFHSWEVQMHVLFLLTPALAKNGFGGYGGARFQLADNFPSEFDECIKSIITTMPFNIMNWYKDDIFSDKLVLIFKKYLKDGNSAVTRHIIALLVCAGRPMGFQNLIRTYIGSIGKNSYYLGDLNTNLRHNYKTQFMNEYELKQTEALIKVCFEKRRTGSQLPGKASAAKVSGNIIPDRIEVEEV